jgi:hypothetical protein
MSANSNLLDYYVERYNEGDLDACIELYAEDAVQRMHDGAHQQTIAEAKTKLFREFVAGHTMTFYGEPSPALAGVLKAMGTTYTTFSFF